MDQNEDRQILCTEGSSPEFPDSFTLFTPPPLITIDWSSSTEHTVQEIFPQSSALLS